MNLLHPWLLLGLVGASLPLLIHLIGRKRAPQVHFAAFDFLVAVNKRLARRERLRQLLLLLLRTAALAGLALGAARPLRPQHALVSQSNRRMALVLDTSASMAYELAGTPLLQRAKKQARDALSHLQPGDVVTLVTAGPEVRAFFMAPTLDHAAVRRAIDSLDTAEGTADLGAAVDKALAQLPADGTGASLVIISDLAQNSFDKLRPTAMDPPPDIRLLDAADRDDAPKALPNAAIQQITVDRSGDSAAERQFKIMVQNHGAVAVTHRAVELSINGSVSQRGYIDLPARGGSEKVLTHSFDTPGVFVATVRLAPGEQDGFARDDMMHVVVDVARGVHVLAVNGEPRTTPYEDELFFVERALGAVPKGDPPITLSIIEPGQLSDAGQDLSGFDAIVLANVGSLPEAAVQRIKKFVEDGGGLMFTCGPRLNFETANAAYGSLLPHPLRDLHLAADAAAGTPALGIGDFDWDHPILQNLGMAAEESLRASRTSRYFNLDTGSGVKARTLLRYENGAPALVERRVGPGRVLLLTTSIDLDYTDLPLRTAYVALLQRSMRYLAKAMDTGAAAGVREGGTAEIPVPTGVSAVALVSPTGDRDEQKVAANAGGRVRFVDLDEVGVYTAETLRQSWAPEPRLNVAVNPSLEESDFLPVRPERISEALGGHGQARTVNVTLGDSHQSDPFEVRGFATYLLVAVCLLFVGESMLAARG